MADLKNSVRYGKDRRLGDLAEELLGELTSTQALRVLSSPLIRSSLARIHVIITNVASNVVVNGSAPLTRSAIEEEPDASGHSPQIRSGRK